MRYFLFVSLFLSLCVMSPSGVFARQDGAGKEKKYLQTYVNASIIVSDFKKLSGKLNDITKQYSGSITNFSISKNEDTGSATLQIPAEKATSLMGELNQLGAIENQNLSTSDYTQSYKETCRRLKFYQAFSDLDLNRLFSGMNVSREEIQAFKSEFESMISGQVRSCESSLQSYENYGKYTQVSLNFRKGESQGNQGAFRIQTVQEVPVEKSNNEACSPVILLLYVAVFFNFFFLYFIYRQLKRTPLGS